MLNCLKYVCTRTEWITTLDIVHGMSIPDESVAEFV